MAGELVRVRSKFVAKVSKSMINQLLDALLEDRLLNDGEVQSVTEDHKNKAGMARALIDTVRNKGDKASWKLIGYIQDRDPSLHEELGLGSGLVRSDPPAPPTQNIRSDRPKPVTDPVRRGKMNEIYKVTDDSIKSRVALLITNRNFTDARLTRRGAEIDEKNMLELLVFLKYEVVQYNDLTAKGIEEALGEFITHPNLADTDSVFVVIMSHGKREFILGVDYTEEKPDEFPVDKIYEYLGPKKCSALLDKPKIIIIQACRGEKGGAAIVSDSVKLDVVSDEAPFRPPAPAMTIVDDAVRYVHVEKDYISLLSSTPDTVSYRSEEFGSFMILYIFEVFNSHSHEDDLEELFRRVMRRFEDFPDATKRVMPVRDRCSLTKRFYFFSGH